MEPISNSENKEKEQISFQVNSQEFSVEVVLAAVIWPRECLSPVIIYHITLGLCFQSIVRHS